MKRKLLFLMALLVSTTMAWADDSGSCGTNLTWSYNSSTGALTITGTGAMADWEGANDRPWNAYRENITSVSLPEGLTTIGNHAFRNFTSLTSIDIPSTVTIIGEGSFMASHITSITLHEGLETIGTDAFNLCVYITGKVEIPASVTSIGAEAFAYTRIEHVVLKRTSVDTTVGENIFQGNNSNTDIKCISVPSDLVDDYQGDANWNKYTDQITAINESDNLNWSYNDGSLFIWKNSSAGAGTMNDYTEGTAPWAANPSSITNVTIYDGVTSIGAYAFSGCTALTEIKLNAGLTSIGANAFSDCSTLATLIVKNSSSVTSLGTGALSGCSALSLISVPLANKAAYKADTNWATYAGKIKSVVIWGSSELLSLGNLSSNKSASAEEVTMTTGDPGEYNTTSQITAAVGAVVMAGDFDEYYDADITIAGKYTFSTELGNISKIVIDYNADLPYICTTGWTDNTTTHQLTWEGTASNSVDVTACIAVDRIMFYLDEATLTANEADGAYWCTYYNSTTNADVDANTTVYTVSVSGNTATLHEIEDGNIKAGEGVVLKSTASTITLTYNSNATTGDFSTNVLEGFDLATTISGTDYADKVIYTLAGESDDHSVTGAGFYKYTGSTLGAHKAFLPLNAEVAAGARGFVFQFEETSGVNEELRMKNEEFAPAVYYNLKGHRRSSCSSCSGSKPSDHSW